MITKLLYGAGWAVGVAVTGALLFAWLWYGMPITTVVRGEESGGQVDRAENPEA